MSDKILLIDGDIILFKFACRHESKIVWPNGRVSQELDPQRAKWDVDGFVTQLQMQTHCREFKFIFTNKMNFRYKVLPTYKHNRVNSEPPALLKVVKDYIRQTYPWETRDWLEADDLMGIYGTRQPDRYVLATIDKDFLSLPATVFLWNKMDQPQRISQEEADYYFHKQWLMGDRTDGYEGIRGIGPKKAEKILDAAGGAWTDAVIEAYADKCYSWEAILQQARMARILRHSDYNHVKREVILWTPYC